MTRSGFLDDERDEQLIPWARDGSTISRVTRRANAIVLLDAGWSASEVANAFLLDDDTIRGWRKLYEQRGIEGLTTFDTGGSSSYLSAAQEDVLSLGRRDAAVFDAPCGRMDREGTRPCLREPVRVDRAAASPWLRLSQARSVPVQARRRQAEDLHRGLRESAEFAARQRECRVHRRGASNPCCAARWLLGAQSGEAGGRTNQRATAHQYSRRD